MMNQLISDRRSMDLPTRVRTSSESLSARDTFVVDTLAPSRVPMEKVIYGKQWNWHPKGSENTFKFDKVGIWDTLSKLKWGKLGSIVDSEIHLIYHPHLPMERFRENMIEISLTFEGTWAGEEVLSEAIFPSPLHTHVIFYPGHSFSVKMGSKFPWKIKATTEADIDPKYPFADILIFFKGYNTRVSQHSVRHGADIISLIPVEETPTRITLSRPREGGEWTMKGIQVERDIQLLQEAGIDVEGLQLVGRLKEAIKISFDIQNTELEMSFDDLKQLLRNNLQTFYQMIHGSLSLSFLRIYIFSFLMYHNVCPTSNLYALYLESYRLLYIKVVLFSVQQ